MSAGTLAGRRVFVGREQAGDRFVAALREAGATVECAALTRTVAGDAPAAQQTAADLAAGHYDWLVLTSPRALEYWPGLEHDVLAYMPTKVAAVGARTAQRYEQISGSTVALVGSSDGPALARELVSTFEPDSTPRILLAQSAIARPETERVLRSAGAEVTRVAVYTTEPVLADTLPQGLAERWRSGHFDFALFTAGSAARAAAQLLGHPGEHTRIITLGKPSRVAAENAGLTVTAHAPSPTPAGVMTACQEATMASRAAQLADLSRGTNGGPGVGICRRSAGIGYGGSEERSDDAGDCREEVNPRPGP